ncbi:hypothetical protein DFJ74DRAFT_85005 [Hyaloraphidium curvatum]|nr:hypothetical protein DFJ74DRAFT_85005 [Hyaloraphidium curvatum]
MPIYAFVVDTSPPMKQPLEPVGLGASPLSSLEVAKAGIEHFYKLMEQQNRFREEDRLVLVTYDPGPGALKCNLKDSRPFFLSQVKNLRAESEAFDVGRAFNALFEHLNLNWVAGGYDTAGFGRFVGWYEMCFVFWYTCAERASSAPGAEGETISIPGLRTPGANHFLEPFRWDQRLSTLLLQSEPPTAPPNLLAQATAMAGDMGGDAYFVPSARAMLWTVENIVGGDRRGLHAGVRPERPVLFEVGMNATWELMDADGSPAGGLFKATIFHDKAKQGFANWPIPEPFWCDVGLKNIPSASAVPLISVSLIDTSLSLPNGVQADKFAVAYSPLTEKLAARPAGTCWMVHVRGSGREPGIGEPFGFLRMNSTGSTVHLHVLPYDPKRFFVLFVGCYRVAPIAPPKKWHGEFRNYLKSVPIYEWQPIRNLLKKVEQGKLFPDDLWRAYVDRRVASLNGKIKNEAKAEFEKLAPVQLPKAPTKPSSRTEPSAESIRARLVKDPASVPGPELFVRLQDMRLAIFQAFGLSLPTSAGRRGLVPSDPSHDPPGGKHDVPISEMGDFSAAMNRHQLRDPHMDEEQLDRWRRQAFGNPYKLLHERTPELEESPPPDESNEIDNEAQAFNYVVDDSDAASRSTASSRSSQVSLSGIPVRRKHKMRRSWKPERPFDPSRLVPPSPEQRRALGFNCDEDGLHAHDAAYARPSSPPATPLEVKIDREWKDEDWMEQVVESPAPPKSPEQAGRKRKIEEIELDDEEELYGPSDAVVAERRSSQPASPIEPDENVKWPTSPAGPIDVPEVAARMLGEAADVEADAGKTFVDWRYEITKLFQRDGRTFDEDLLVRTIRASLLSALTAKEKTRLFAHCMAMCDSFRKSKIRIAIERFDPTPAG